MQSRPERAVYTLPQRVEAGALRQLIEKKLFAVSGDGRYAASILRDRSGTFVDHSVIGHQKLPAQRAGAMPRIVAVTPRGTKVWMSPRRGETGLYLLRDGVCEFDQPLDALEGVMRTPRAFVPFGRAHDDPVDKLRYVFSNGSFVVDREAPITATQDGSLIAVERCNGVPVLQHFRAVSPAVSDDEPEANESEIICTMPLPFREATRIWPLWWQDDYAFVYETASGFFQWIARNNVRIPGEVERAWCSPTGKGFAICQTEPVATLRSFIERKVLLNGYPLVEGALFPIEGNQLVWSPSGEEAAVISKSVDHTVEEPVVMTRIHSRHSTVTYQGSRNLREPLVDDHGAVIAFVLERDGSSYPSVYTRTFNPASDVWNLRHTKSGVAYNTYNAETGEVFLLQISAP